MAKTVVSEFYDSPLLPAMVSLSSSDMFFLPFFVYDVVVAYRFVKLIW